MRSERWSPPCPVPIRRFAVKVLFTRSIPSAQDLPVLGLYSLRRSVGGLAGGRGDRSTSMPSQIGVATRPGSGANHPRPCLGAEIAPSGHCPGSPIRSYARLPPPAGLTRETCMNSNKYLEFGRLSSRPASSSPGRIHDRLDGARIYAGFAELQRLRLRIGNRLRLRWPARDRPPRKATDGGMPRSCRQSACSVRFSATTSSRQY